MVVSVYIQANIVIAAQLEAAKSQTGLKQLWTINSKARQWFMQIYKLFNNFHLFICLVEAI